MNKNQVHIAALTKILIGLVVFVLAMTITFSDVSGVPYNYPSKTDTSTDNPPADGSFYSAPPPTNDRDVLFNADDDPNIYSFDQAQNIEKDITSIPEPGTLLMLLTGLTVIRAVRKKK